MLGCHELQSKACEQQEQIAELGRRVAELEVERADLASRNAMLQKLATIRGDGAASAEESVGKFLEIRRLTAGTWQNMPAPSLQASVLGKPCCMQGHCACMAPQLRCVSAWRPRATLLCRRGDAAACVICTASADKRPIAGDAHCTSECVPWVVVHIRPAGHQVSYTSCRSRRRVTQA
jgi:hypothetical protein